MNKRLFFSFTLAPIFLVLLLIWGCVDKSLAIQVRFDEISGLQQDDGVYFEGNSIGKVGEISYTKQGDYLVELTIKPEFRNAATEDSKFFVGSDPTTQQDMAVIVLQEKSGGRVLEDGSIAQGSAGSGYLDKIISDLSKTTGVAEKEMRQVLERLQESLGAASQQLDSELEYRLGELSEKLREFKNEAQKVPESPKVKEFERSVKQFADEFEKARKDVRDHLRDEVIPQLRMELEELREKLKKEGRQDELEEIDKRVEEMITV
ncbi:MlaD family protein [Desulfopila inferna]|uniref:MlaD family protein n=1 Tax=Desulfopila inferna TaxID=468528 RepID=UPI001965BCF1|nr:MlaD family protein [Desulfopila inferna]MBM9604557.1 MCE family protein [Desulfopila inferna]